MRLEILFKSMRSRGGACGCVRACVAAVGDRGSSRD
jgi:hypothetical protein